MSTSERIEDIAGRLYDFAVDNGDRNEAVYSAKAELTKLIDEQVLAGRIDEKERIVMGDTADRDEAEFWGSEDSVEYFKDKFSSKSTNTKNITKYGEVYVVLNEYMDYISTSGHDGDGEFTSGQVIKPNQPN